MGSEQEREQIRTAYLGLIHRCKVFANRQDLIKIDLAIEWAGRAHEMRVSFSGQPYMVELLETAQICCEQIGLGHVSVISCLLHNIHLEPAYELKLLEEKFGPEVRSVVEGVEKLSGFQTDKISDQSEHFRELFLTFINDIRVVLIMVARKIYQVEYFDKLTTEMQDLCVVELQHLYIPIVHRLGLYHIKSVFEEQVMKSQKPDVFLQLSEKIKASQKKLEVYMEDFTRPLRSELSNLGYAFDLKWRVKSIPSIWAKMVRQNVPFEQVYDLFAIRIILDVGASKEKEACWHVYSVVTNLYHPNPKRLRDWITTPKASGYESLHITVEGVNSKWVEVQIRSTRMDEVAEKGQAAHWKYKGDSSSKDASEWWLRQVREALEKPPSEDADLVSKTSHNSEQDRIFVFTPDGDLKKLRSGATVLDFAYEIHTAVGGSCSGAKLNGKIVPIRHTLKNGDLVQIITSKRQKPKLDWLSFVKTDRAKSKIKRQLKEEAYKLADNGKELIYRKFKNWKVKDPDLMVAKMVAHFKMQTAVDLYHMLATDKIELNVIKQLVAGWELEREKQTPLHMKEEVKNPKIERVKDSHDVLLLDSNLSGVNYRIAKCCKPIPGDDVFGFITIGKGITIHRLNCPNSKRLLSEYEYRIVDIDWKKSITDESFLARLKLIGKDRLGLVGEVSQLIADDHQANLRAINFDTQHQNFQGKLLIKVQNASHLEQLMHKLQHLAGVEKVIREH